MIAGMRRALGLACVVGVFGGWTLPCAAQVASLSWSAPRGCPDQASVAARLTALPAEPARRDLKVRARVQRVGRARYALKLVLRAADYHAERRLESTSCTSVTDAAVWLVAVALDPSASTGSITPLSTGSDPSEVRPPAAAPGPASTGQPEPPSVASADVRATSPATAAAASRAPGEPSSDGSAPPASATRAVPMAASASTAPVSHSAGGAPWRVDWAALPRWWRAGLFGGVWSAALPAPQASLGGRVGLGIGGFYTELRGAAELPRARPLADSTEVRFATQDLGLALCAQWGARVRGGPCATASALRTKGSTRGAPEASDQVLPWGAAGVSLELGFRPVGGLEIMFETGAQLPISARPRFTVEGVGEVAVAAPVTVYARLGLGFRSTDAAREQ
jgi:hypothetical protein